MEDDVEDSGGGKEEDLEDYLNDPDFQNMSDSEGDDLPLFEVKWPYKYKRFLGQTYSDQ